MTAISPGARLGPYQILEPIGAGGMGEVYKASDTRLDRVVAVKVLPHHWAANAEMRQRFEREAQTLASLNHPHICVLHDIGNQEGTDFLVMEYLEGETLAERLERGALGLAEALKLGLEIADALDKAHRKGVVHRDLKPSNVMLTKSGTKLLDFGLAKFARGGSSASVTDSLTALPTGKDLTSAGTVLGTLQYMAPEQLEGLEADARTDIFAYGALLHEMVTGKKAFEGKSRVLLISAIATSTPPPLSSVEPAAPQLLDHIVKTCLAKEPADRWQTSRDLLAELECVAEGGAEATDASPVAPSTRKRLWLQRVLLAGSGLLAGAVVAAMSLYLRPAAAEELRFRVPIQLTAETTVAGGRGNNAGAAQGYQGVSGPAVFNPSNFAISPDGRKLAFVARQNNQGAGGADSTWYLYIRPIGAVTSQRLAGTEGATQPFWSADSRSIAFAAEGKLKRVEASGGPPQEICEAGSFNGGTWNGNGTILFGSTQGVQRVPAEGGKPQAITHIAESDSGHWWPHFLPDGRHFLYTAWSAQPGGRSIMAGTIDSPDQKTKVLPAGSNAGYAEPGYLVFHRDEAVYAQSFNVGKLSVSGEPLRVANEISYDTGNGRGDFSVARSGALAYFYTSNISASPASGLGELSEWQYSWMSRTAQILESVGPPGVYRGVNVSPDTKRVAVHRHDTNGGDIIVFEPRGSDTRLTLDASQHNSMPIWSPDGSQIVFASLRNGKWGLYQTLSTRSGSQQLLYESDVPTAPMSWSPDGKRIVFWVQDPKTAGDIWVLTVEDKKASKLIATAFNEIHPQISPDGKWIAYTDNSKDNRNEIYVQPFPSGTDRYQISNDGGDWPRWRDDSKELFYHSIGLPNTPGVSAGATPFAGLLFSVSIDAKGPVLEPGAPRQVVIFPAINVPHNGGSYQPYAVDPKGERFFVPQFVPPTAVTSGTQIGPDTFSGLTVALNWTSALKK
jgi:Tol biopolymer transport system component/predicted Ser/Thr protein kinase